MGLMLPSRNASVKLDKAPLYVTPTGGYERGSWSGSKSWHFSVFALRMIAGVLCIALGFHLLHFPQRIPQTKPSLDVQDPPESQDSDVCLTPACVHASSEILYNLSPNYKNIDPCTNFEELVCGGWRERHDLRPDQGDAFTGTQMFEASQTLLRHILEAEYPTTSAHSYFSPAMLESSSSSLDEENFKKLKAAYNACLDEDTIKKVGVAPLKDILRELTQISSSGEFNDDHHEFITKSVQYLAKLDVTALVAPGTGPDDKDPDTVTVSVSAPYRIGLPAKELYNDDKLVAKYEVVVSEVLPALLQEPLDPGSDIFHRVVEFEKALAYASPDAEDRDDVTKYYNPMSVADADALAPQLRLSKLIDSLEPCGFETDRIIVMAPQYLKDLNDILSNTTDDVLHAYFFWKAIQKFSSYVEADALTPYKRFVNELQGKDPDSTPERWRTCVGHVDNGLGWILSRFFVEKAFSAKAKEFGDQIVSDIKAQFIETLKRTEWMEDEVVELAISKVHNIVQKIGYPTKSPDIMDPKTLHAYYERVNISASSYFSNAVALSKFDIRREWSALGKPVDRNEWGMTVPTVNAYYNPPGNEIVFPAGIMQFPVFDVNVPQYVSYGAFGSVSGHELSHAFDSTGRHYDQNGNYTDWWTNTTVAAFKDRAECFVEQYHNFSIKGTDGKPLHVNGRLTLGENIADAGGVSAAFSAWKKRDAESRNQNLPGLDFFSQEQLFFVSYASWWCGKTRTKTAVNRIYTDPHSPKWARVLGTMANSRNFKDSFSCAKREPVCALW
ncbi:endothelin-converting enzyme [Patellaria atrata CBS 101060]|uniref:Endothelin-converting enzyme n=1 Tax=Patellaria atrata CBS 101060 TaxID=1346257 RepID=A0A9P4VPF8_9PEZI|nr:endothelin-converting enzyme [Patellaria atrata CBS 101060]